jgi:hypothetical protein
LATHIATDTTHRHIAVLGGWQGFGLVYFRGSDLQVWEIEQQVEPVDLDPIPFPFRLEFPIAETFVFATNIIEAEDQTEQRIALSDPDVPRRKLRAHVIVHEPGESDHLSALLFGGNVRRYLVPQWQHSTHLDVSVVATGTVLQVRSTAFRELIPGRQLMLWTWWDTWEVVTILTVDSDTQITLADPLVSDWPGGLTEVIPLRVGVLDSVVPINQKLNLNGCWRRFSNGSSHLFRVPSSNLATRLEFIYSGLAVYSEEE